MTTYEATLTGLRADEPAPTEVILRIGDAVYRYGRAGEQRREPAINEPVYTLSQRGGQWEVWLIRYNPVWFAVAWEKGNVLLTKEEAMNECDRRNAVRENAT